MADFRDQVARKIPELGRLDPAMLAGATVYSLDEGIRTGVAAVVHAQSREMEFAILEWHHATVTLKGASGEVIDTIETEVDLHDLIEGGVEPEFDTPYSVQPFPRPDGWVANTVRYHFAGSPGFERLASSLIFRPWFWGDPLEYDFWTPDPQDAESCPVASPRHSVAAAIEGNLLYADAEGSPERRLDRLLLAEIRRVSTVVDRFRTEHEARRLASREVLLAQWRRERES